MDWCACADAMGELMDHLLLHCGEAHWLWNFVFKSFGVAWGRLHVECSRSQYSKYHLKLPNTFSRIELHEVSRRYLHPSTF